MAFQKYRPPDRSKYLLDHEIKLLLETAKSRSSFEASFLSFMANTGVRPSEAKMVRAQDIFPQESRARVRTLKQKKEDGKEKIIHRDVDLSATYAKRLGKMLKGVSSRHILFPRSRQAFWGIFKRTAEAAGLPKSYTLYSLRHSRCIYLLEWTDDLMYVCQQMGHSSLDVTRSYYHCLPSKRAQYVQNKLGTF